MAKNDNETRTYNGTLRMHEAKELAIAKWGEDAKIFNGKPTIANTYKVGRIVVDKKTGKSSIKWLGIGNDWDAAFKAAHVALPKTAKVTEDEVAETETADDETPAAE
jgi:hypothetical protein